MTASPLQVASAVAGVVFLAVGLLGFVPGITQNLGSISIAGPGSDAKLLGIFEVNVLHNVVHVLFGIIGLIAAGSIVGARTFLVWGGVVYLVLWLYGLLIDVSSAVNVVSLNTADNWLHFGLGAGMVGLGRLLPRADGHGRAA